MRNLMNVGNAVTVLVCALFFLTNDVILAQSVSVGQGSYSTSLPAGAEGPVMFVDGMAQPAVPKIADTFSKPIQTNDFWSSLIFPRSNNPHSNNIFAHPLMFRSSDTGLQMGYAPPATFDDFGYGTNYSHQITVGVSGLLSEETLTVDYGDWTVSVLWEDDAATLNATFGHGLPYAFFKATGGNAQITTVSPPSIWHNVDEVLGIQVDGVIYALFAPQGASWTGTTVLESSLNGKDYFSVAVLPDSTAETLEFYRKHAYSFVTNSTVEWEYYESTANLTSTFSYETELMDSNETNVNETLTALYRHQWLNTIDALTSYTYSSPRGIMKVSEGNSFTTTNRFSGVLPSLPDVGSYDRIQLLEFVQDVATETLPIADTYNNGKQMGRFAELVHIADQLGAIAERDYFLSEIKLRLEDWFTVGGAQEYSYNSIWNTLTGYPASFGSDLEINDHHFHAAYAIRAAATVAQYDSVWAAQENWGGMVNLLIKDASNWDETDTRFPKLRNHDSYAGHSWAAGHADFEFGNNQESSSEAMNYASSTILWGEITNQEEIRDLGIFLYTNENEAIEEYWFDVNDEVFPADFPNEAVGIVWSSGGAYTTWFGQEPEFIHGINLLPMNSGSFYLGKETDYILENYNEVVEARGGQPIYWKDVFWQYLAMSDADLALSYYYADPSYEPFDGKSRAHTLHWLYNMKAMGHFNTEVTADIPTYAVFVNENSDTTYIVYNATSVEKLVTFSDGHNLTVPSNTMLTENTVEVVDSIPAAPEPIIENDLVISIFSDRYPNLVDADFDPDEGQSTEAAIVLIEGNNTLKYDSLDFQSINLNNNINVSSRNTFHIDYYTSDATTLQLTLISSNPSEAVYDFTITTNAWQSVEIPFSSLSDSLDLSSISKILFTGNGTVYLDNIFFSGDTPFEVGPTEGAPEPLLDPADVLSVFSDSYDGIPIASFSPEWGQETQVSFVEIEGNSTLKYSNLNYQGTEFENPTDVSNMEWFHLDYWTSNSTNLRVYLISPGPVETPFEIDIKPNSWQSIDIPLTEFSSVVDLSEVFQIKTEGDGTLYLDNLYFAKPPDLTPAPIPIHDSTKVVSLFSNHYENIIVDTWSAPWDQAGVEDVQIDGNDAKLYTDVNFVGIEFFRTDQIDGTDLTHLYFEIWTADPIDSTTNFQVKLVDFGANGGYAGGDDVEHELTFDVTTTPGFESKEWISFDIPLSDFINMTTKEHLSQLLLVSRAGIDEFYMDNLYFYIGEGTNSEEDNTAGIPSHVQLQQNYPNPFNPSTNIAFSIPQSSDVRLVIYNSIGQQVSILMDSRLSAGSYTVKWDASNVSSGVYFYQLQAGGYTTTKQMLLIK